MVVIRRHRTLGIWFWMSSWYVCSLMTLLMTKTILSTKRVDVNELGIAQLLTTAFLGSLKVLGPSILQVMNCTRMRRPMFQSYRNQRRKSDGILPVSHDLNNSGRGSKQVKAKRSGSRFWEDMIYLGLLRGSTVALKLLSLSLLAASFTETVKASAPIVTVLFAWLILKEKTTLRLVASLFPIMAGLIICSATELSFNTIGFMAALANNVLNCVQNVISKRVLRHDLSPVKLQFYTSVIAVAMQMPLVLWNHRASLHLLEDSQALLVQTSEISTIVNAGAATSISEVGVGMMQNIFPRGSVNATNTTEHMNVVGSISGAGNSGDTTLSEIHQPPGEWSSDYLAGYVLFCCIAYHMQSVSAYYTMSLLSPVTQSVANSMKKALSIFLSILYFGNKVNPTSVAGILMVSGGVMNYRLQCIKGKKAKNSS